MLEIQISVKMGQIRSRTLSRWWDGPSLLQFIEPQKTDLTCPQSYFIVKAISGFLEINRLHSVFWTCSSLDKCMAASGTSMMASNSENFQNKGMKYYEI